MPIRIALAISLKYQQDQQKWLIEVIDIEAAFLNTKLEEDIWIGLREMFPGDVQDKEILKLHSAVYGVVQAPRAWMKTLSRMLKVLGLTQS
jgi:hypothetical protein